MRHPLRALVLIGLLLAWALPAQATFLKNTVTNAANLTDGQLLVGDLGAHGVKTFAACTDGLIITWSGGAIVCGSISAAPTTSKYLLQQADASLPNAQVLGALASGCLSVTTTTGVVASSGSACGGSGVTSIATTSPITGGTITTTGTIACATCTTNASALTANLPMIGGGGQASAVGTRSGNTTAFVTTTGAQTSGDCVKIDASGNHIANGSACGGGGSSYSTTVASPVFSSLVASTTYTFNSGSMAATGSVGAFAFSFPAPATGHIAAVYYSMVGAGTQGSGGTTSKFLVNNFTGSTASTGCTVSLTAAAGTPAGCTESPNLAVTAGNLVNVQVQTQAWSVVPTNTYWTATIVYGS